VNAIVVNQILVLIVPMLAGVRLQDVFKGIDVYYLAAVKLIAVPSATMVGVFAEKFDGDRALASRSVFLTTVLSMITIPLAVSWV
jgi:malate permease and related proteins